MCFCLEYWQTMVPARSPNKERARFDAQNGIPQTIFFLSNICQVFCHVAQVPTGSASVVVRTHFSFLDI